MAAYVSLVNTAGQAVAVNPDQAALLIAVAPNITRVMINTGAGETGDAVAPYVDIALPLAAVIVALSFGASPLGVLAMAVIDGATGNLLPGIGQGVFGAVRNAAGDYTVTLSAAPPANGFGIVSSADGGDGVISTDGPFGLSTNVKSFDTAGLAADKTFTFVAIGTPP